MSNFRPNAQTRLAAVIGWPVAHSKSPDLHNAAFSACGINAMYLALPVAAPELAAAVGGLRALAALGASVTVPHKESVLLLCDALSPAAAAIGAVNTLEFRADQGVIGHNTDAPGYVRAFEAAAGSVRGRRVLILGGGGAARAIAHGLTEAGVVDLKVIARRPDAIGWTEAQAWSAETLCALLGACDVLIDCTSIGLSEANEASLPAPIPVSLLPRDALVSTLVYHRETALLRAARERGLQTLDGAGMLVHQAALAFALWTGTEAPLEVMQSAFSTTP